FNTVTFEYVIVEPASVRSFDKIQTLLAVPVALVAGLVFAFLSCLHICVQILVINLHWIKVVWHNVLDIAISPFFRSFGECCGFIRISLEKY
uniref:Caveolin n=1 Tax=Cyprinus carpio TaxID=7962 RepID=A0A8C1GPH4_CYPCA